MKKQELLYEGKAKKIYASPQSEQVIIEFKDDATAFNGQKKGQIAGKGIINNAISNFFFQLLEAEGIATHFLKNLSSTEVLARKLAIIPVEVVMRNLVAGSLARRLGLEEGLELKAPVLEFYYKDDALGDPMINEDHILALELCSREELATIKELAWQTNQVLHAFLQKRGIELVDFKLEFGKDAQGKIYLGDEISPDTCRFWDSKSKKRLDKDRFRRDLGGVAGAYQEILQRLTGSEVK